MKETVIAFVTLALLAACAHHDAIQPAARNEVRMPLSREQAAGATMAQGQDGPTTAREMPVAEEPVRDPAPASDPYADAGSGDARAADPLRANVEVELAEKSPLAPDPARADGGSD